MINNLDVCSFVTYSPLPLRNIKRIIYSKLQINRVSQDGDAAAGIKGGTSCLTKVVESPVPCLDLFEREMRWDGVGTWLPPGVPRSLDSQGLGSAQSVSLSKSGLHPVFLCDFSLPNSSADYLPCPRNYL
ncbi:hypothetical protein TNCV_4481381 [Trichonephila clavipes]|nr:hypothetical protein TNCV_4481381 [Trichonephila clavipes]